MYETIIVETSGQIAKITLNRPKALNALNPTLLRELGDALGEIAGNESINAVIITGAGRAFSAGVDIKGMDASSEESSAEGRTKLALKIIDTVENMNTPVIAAVNGYCLTGGLELAIACDIIKVRRYPCEMGIDPHLGGIPAPAKDCRGHEGQGTGVYR